MKTADASDAWDHFQQSVDNLLREIRGVTAVAVNSASLKAEARSAVQYYFRTARPWIIGLGLPEAELELLDTRLQDLNVLTLGNNRKNSYLAIGKQVLQDIAVLGTRRDMLVGKEQIRPKTAATPQQEKIIDTLDAMLPSAANSFRQVMADLSDGSRRSFRGTAAELREILREVVDHLAPDSAVIAAPGFQLEKGRIGPTMRQKVRFIMKNRGRGSGAAATSEDALSGADALVRSLYNRGSAAVHSDHERAEVLRIRGYAEAILVDILEIE